jgi:hypothetical protein
VLPPLQGRRLQGACACRYRLLISSIETQSLIYGARFNECVRLSEGAGFKARAHAVIGCRFRVLKHNLDFWACFKECVRLYKDAGVRARALAVIRC